ncbi:hypothetical protein [Actinomadura rubrisoli]|uniref:Uncharacterized protein n=1 Tax=Actinomadura rubrisoli TaxID=2530368 RepID=A0A4R5BPZ6_9ACTN|nr:hypothetical protein [Actinomadura rubrisoli]TDD88019.1 hypothetical protein E1298_15530 [Actinomadura rubrisoli]
MTVLDELAEIGRWWELAGPAREAVRRIAGGPSDQAGFTDNPYWDIVRQLPSLDGGRHGPRPDGFARGLPVGHHALTKRYAWAIPSPGDIAWLAAVLGPRALVEIGAGSGYWAWQARQAGIDVIAYEPADPLANAYTDGIEYFPLRPGDHTAARRHPDRALLLCWPSGDDPWASQALRAYTGDMVVYIGERRGGRCADDGFFQRLGREWTAVGASPHHVSWRYLDSTATAYRRTARRAWRRALRNGPAGRPAAAAWTWRPRSAGRPRRPGRG